jgi:hypothetical protein
MIVSSRSSLRRRTTLFGLSHVLHSLVARQLRFCTSILGLQCGAEVAIPAAVSIQWDRNMSLRKQAASRT